MIFPIFIIVVLLKVWGWGMAKTDNPNYKTVFVSDLIPYARNSRTHGEVQINKIASSIKEFGFLNPVLIDKTTVLLQVMAELWLLKTKD